MSRWHLPRARSYSTTWHPHSPANTVSLQGRRKRGILSSGSTRESSWSAHGSFRRLLSSWDMAGMTRYTPAFLQSGISRQNEPPPNNGLHPTRDTNDFINLQLVGGRVIGGARPLTESCLKALG